MKPLFTHHPESVNIKIYVLVIKGINTIRSPLFCGHFAPHLTSKTQARLSALWLFLMSGDDPVAPAGPSGLFFVGEQLGWIWQTGSGWQGDPGLCPTHGDSPDGWLGTSGQIAAFPEPPNPLADMIAAGAVLSVRSACLASGVQWWQHAACPFWGKA